jgi:hypothetical protein
MRKFGVLTALTLSWITASCAERMVHQGVIHHSNPPKAASRPIPNNVEVRRRAETIAENTGKRPAIRSGQVTPSASVKPEQPPELEAQSPQASEQPPEAQTSPDPPMATVLPPPLETDESNFPFAALMPPPPEPAEPTFPSVSPIVELQAPAEPATSVLPEVPIEAALPPPPEPAEPSFPVATLMSPPPEPAEPSLPPPPQAQIAAESLIPILFPDLPSYLSLSPRFDWVDTVGAIEVPRGPVPETSEASPEKQIPSLIRSPWALPTDGT